MACTEFIELFYFMMWSIIFIQRKPTQILPMEISPCSLTDINSKFYPVLALQALFYCIPESANKVMGYLRNLSKRSPFNMKI